MLLESLKFSLFDWLRPDFTQKHFSHLDRGLVEQLLQLSEQLGSVAMAPISQLLDRQPPALVNGAVQTPVALKEALAALAQSGIFATTAPLTEGGTAMPFLVHTAIASILCRFDAPIYGYVLLTQGAANLIRAFGTADQRARFLPAMVAGRHFGTMCLSEPHAGSSVGDARTRATPLGAASPGRYAIAGGKMWISGAEHGLSENIIHLVLARIDGAPAGTKGLSLFIVPRLSADVGASAGLLDNHVRLAGLNHKMGYRATVNGALNFGDGGVCVGELLGAPGSGMAQMFQMMNEARIAVGVGAAATGWRGFELALDYAKTRTQGRRLGNSDALSPQIPIIEHMDVRRMLLRARALSEGAVSLCLYAANVADQAQHAPDASDAQAAQRSAKLLSLLTPMVKSWPSKYALEANDLAIQVLGGAGYTQDYLLEKLYRDNRLNPIHEGTHGIQGLDLLARKIFADDGEALLILLQRIALTAQAAAKIAPLAGFAPGALEQATQLAQAALALAAVLKAGNPEAALANATLVLDALGTVVVCWLTLDQCVAALNGPEFQRLADNCWYLHTYELPSVAATLSVLSAADSGQFWQKLGWGEGAVRAEKPPTLARCLLKYQNAMNYRHSFHAGNFADCLKHALMLELLRALTEKPTPMHYFETHAGRGRYALDALEIERAEWHAGIGKLIGMTGLPPELHRYVERVKSVNSGEFGVYPGSPLLAAARLRAFDTLELCELETTQAAALTDLFARDPRVTVHSADGYQRLKAALPPAIKRGVVLIDPPYENHAEFSAIAQALDAALKRWATGIYVVWYPIKIGRELAPFYRALTELPAKNILIAEMCVHPDVSDLRLNGCGMAILNAPFRFESATERALKALHRILRVEARARAGWRWLRAPQ